MSLSLLQCKTVAAVPCRGRYFLVSEQESNQRSRLKEALSVALPRAKAALLKNLPGAHSASSSLRNLLKVKMFWPHQGGLFHDARPTEEASKTSITQMLEQ